MKNTQAGNGAEPAPFWQSRYAIGLVVMGAIATYFLLSEHRAHFLGFLPLLLLLSCPLMHVFMHHGHSGHGEHKDVVEHDHDDAPEAIVSPPATPLARPGGPA
ncbi:DUF2933 domain-containing protein [Variovorax sp. RTB1]|jgi:hypothetical protein|nr:DUF2933 domain-containing protein [Variovorax sp. RTB1]MEB0113108.1 DUF2933 domain-containing protein [Variovorax sp. RTB1]